MTAEDDSTVLTINTPDSISAEMLDSLDFNKGYAQIRLNGQTFTLGKYTSDNTNYSYYFSFPPYKATGGLVEAHSYFSSLTRNVCTVILVVLGILFFPSECGRLLRPDAVAGALDAAAGGFGLDAVSVCVDDALDALCDLTGENASEAVIEQVFERFCVARSYSSITSLESIL